MPSPFPGMDPFLEHPARWPEVHVYLTLAIQDDLLIQVGSRYYVMVEQRMRTADPTLPERPDLGEYRVLVSRGHRGHQADLYPIHLRQTLPAARIPLKPDDSEPAVDLQAVVQSVYERGRFEQRIDYRQEAVPPLNDADRQWAAALLRDTGRR